MRIATGTTIDGKYYRNNTPPRPIAQRIIEVVKCHHSPHDRATTARSIIHTATID
ncbi:hypothetical protein [Chamaesiphon sp.]|uniref:hypothetical protein n=1 Tax=Chamaesiphon sp. TaxID=2814140 RepID=UPI00359332F4